MKTLIYACCLATIYFGCQKELSKESTDTPTITGKQWRLTGWKSDTAKDEYWNPLSYDPYYSYNDYYCIPTPNESPFFGRDYLSFYQCTVWENNCYYFLDTPYCDWDRQPVISDTLTWQDLANDITFNTNGSFDLRLLSTQSEFIDEESSTCTDIKYFPASTSDYGYKGTWQLDSTTNIITLYYEQVYGFTGWAGNRYDFTDAEIPKEEKWKIMQLDNGSLSLNNCLQCTEDSGNRKLYKAL